MSSPVPQVRSRMPRIAEAPSRLAGSHLRTSAVERARLTVVPRTRAHAARMPFVALVSLMLLGGVVGLLLFNTSMQQSSFAATALEGQATTLAARQQGLQMELDRLRDPQRIAAAAQHLGMVQACTPAFLRLGSGTVTGTPCAADGSVRFRITPPPPAKPAALDPAPHVVRVTAPPAANTTGDTGAGADANGNAGDKKNQKQHQQHQQHQQQTRR